VAPGKRLQAGEICTFNASGERVHSMNKKQLSERDICTKIITPALEQAGWDIAIQIREEFPLTLGRVIVRGKLHTRAQQQWSSHNGLSDLQNSLVVQDYSSDGSNKTPHYYQLIAINTTIEAIAREKAWWGKRQTTEHAWQVSAQEIADRNFNLDCKNPHQVEVNQRDPEELMQEYLETVRQLQADKNALKEELTAALAGGAAR